MTIRHEEPRNKGAIATFFYGHGLFCSTYPVSVLTFAIVIILVCFSPLVNLPFTNTPQLQWSSISNSTEVDKQPYCFIQQVVLKVAVLPWESDLTLGDAFRAPLYEAFKLLDVVRNYQDLKSLKTLGHICLHIEAVKRLKTDQSNVLPQYSCLVLSPANLWHQDVQEFSQDSSILTTIYNHHSFQKGKTSIAEMLFGMNMVDTGIKRYPLRSRQRIIQYAVSLIFKDHDAEFIDGLHQKLKTLYPLHQNSTSTNTEKTKINDTLFIYYPGEINYVELIPLSIAFILLFLYYYYSVRKMEIIKSKLGMAFTATITVFCSLHMTLGICFFFGLTVSLHGGRAIFPYLAILIGLENVLVLTKSVVQTPLHLDVKIRNAQSLSKEGWAITKNLLLEITIFTMGLFTFVAPIQEFCIFAIVGLLTDFFLQMLFFSTILGIDIGRMENSTEKHKNFRNSLYYSDNFRGKTLNRSKSHPRLANFPTNVVAGQAQGAQEKKIPKRVILVNVWARTRFFQRSIMILMVVWIAMIAYNSDIINQYIINQVVEEKIAKNEQNASKSHNYIPIKLLPMVNKTTHYSNVNYVTHSPAFQQNTTYDLDKLKHSDYAPMLKLSSRHWPAVFKKYNLSLSGQTIALLPNIKISHVITPQQAVLMRNPDEKYGDAFQWQALAAALDPIDFRDSELPNNNIPQSEQPFYPTSPMEIMLTTILCVISVIVLAYLVVLLYRCICSRNYAEWRASWNIEKREDSADEQVLLEAVPVVIEGHNQEIECISTDGASIASVCLGGVIKVWDNNTGQLVSLIDRKNYFKTDSTQKSTEDETFSDYESGSPPTRVDQFPKLLNRINTDFTHVKPSENNLYDSKSDLMRSYKYFYSDTEPKIRNRHKFSDNKRQRNNSRQDESVSLDDSDFSCDNSETKLSPVWCIDFVDNIIVLGCSDGKLEFWEASTGKLSCIFEDSVESGISHLKVVGSKIVTARLCGTVDFFQLQTYNQGRPIDWNFTCAYRRTHVRTGSMGSLSDRDMNKQTEIYEDLKCTKLLSIKGHQQPITCLDCEGGRVLTGSQDHTLKVFKIEDGSALYTLHGHYGPITCLFIDRINPATSGSGSQDGMLCVWDLLTGTCMYNIQAHNGSIVSLTYSASYVISLGTDERLCVWERFQGHLLNTINIPQAYSNHVLMLAPHLVITDRSGGLIIWDVRSGECVRTITLGRCPFLLTNQLILLRDAVIYDYGKQLRIVRFPLITHKFE